ncbi:MAG TPA: type I-U CRISPR-associated protein Csb2 [Clostridia bacterium]|nr:type I-U CRISPR-associated protein Csb2 [Clostridia bacterium]
MIIRCEFLTSRYVAKETHTVPEWPPHPARLFYALVSALYIVNSEDADSCDKNERAAIEWLETLGHPLIDCAPDEQVGRREVLTHYVSANDPDSKSKPEHLPEHRGRSERTFPTRILPDALSAAFFSWPDANPSEFESHRASLESLFQRVSYLGHSSSMVALSFVDGLPLNASSQLIRWSPAKDAPPDELLRGVGPSLLRLLDHVYLPNEFSQQNYRLPHVPVGYVREGAKQPRPAAEQSHFGEKWVVYRLPEWARMPVTAALNLTSNLKTEACRLAKEGTNVLPEALAMLSGHQVGSAAPYTGPHVAWIPLPYVGHCNASGLIYGVAAVLPRELDTMQNRHLAEAIHSILHRIESLPFRGSTLKLERVNPKQLLSPNFPKSLSPAQWCPEAKVWASVTPVALDRYPGFLFGRARRTEAEAITTEKAVAEAEASLRQSCVNIGLPKPTEVLISKYSWVEPAPPVAKFLSPKQRQGKPAPVYAHVKLVFAEKVRGPVLLGKQRYLGYGLCFPLRNGGRQ